MTIFPRLHAPLLAPVVSLSVGIAVGGVGLSAWLLVAALAVVVGLTLPRWRWPLAQGLGVLLSFLLLGQLLSLRIRPAVADGVWTDAVVFSEPSARPRSVAVTLLLPVSGEERRCYLRAAGDGRSLAVGQSLVVRLRDGRFAGAADWHAGGGGLARLSLWQRVRLRALLWRHALLLRYHRLGGSSDVQAVVSAMALGDKSLLSGGLRQTYASTGASHVLALSGLHLSIIYLLLSRLTLGRRRWPLFQVLLLSAVWAFALLTGLSPSVVRAAVMLTVYALFFLGGRRSSPVGVLAFAALLMLMVSPRSLFDVGFQLSFAAMLGIFLFGSLFRSAVSARWLCSHRAAAWVYELTVTSLSAQVATAPLVAYYFGQLPVWFLLTNLFVIPLATAVLTVAVVVMVLPSLGGVLLWLVGLMNSVVDTLSRLPFATVSGLHSSALQVALCYALLLLLYALLAFRQGQRGWLPRRPVPFC